MEVQEAAEAPGDDETGGAFGTQAPGLQQGEHPGADSALGQLQHTDVLLGQGHLRRQGIGVLLVGEGAGFVDDPRPEENRRRIDEAAAADAGGGGAFYGVTEDFALFIGHPVDGAGAGLHTPGDGGTLKDGSGGGGAAQQAAPMPQGQLAVGADVRQEGTLVAGADLAGHQSGGDVRPHKGRNTPGQVQPGFGRCGEP